MGKVYLPDSATGPASLIAVEDQMFTATTPLAAAGVYTSPSITLSGRRIVGSVYSDQAGSFVVQGSDDGETWTTLPVAVFNSTNTGTVTAATMAVFDISLYTALTRIVYTNGATLQTVFRFSAYLSAV